MFLVLKSPKPHDTVHSNENQATDDAYGIFRYAVSFIREIRQHSEKIADGSHRDVARPDLGDACLAFSVPAGNRLSREAPSQACGQRKHDEHVAATRPSA